MHFTCVIVNSHTVKLQDSAFKLKTHTTVTCPNIFDIQVVQRLENLSSWLKSILIVKIGLDHFSFEPGNLEYNFTAMLS